MSDSKHARISAALIVRSVVFVALISPALTVFAGNRTDDNINLGDPARECLGNGVGNPVNVATGNKFQREQDISIDLPLLPKFEFVRFYNSRMTPGFFGADGFGPLWSHNFSATVKVDYRLDGVHFISRPASASMVYGDGKAFSVVWNGNKADPDLVHPGVTDKGSFEYELQEIPGKHLGSLLVKRFTLLTAAGDTLLFEKSDNGEHLLLRSIVDVVGNTITLSYEAHDGRTRLKYVENASAGQSLEFSYNDQELISSVTDHLGRTWTYRYDDRSNLEYVDAPAQKTRRYWYEDTEDPEHIHALTGITDERGVRYATFVYGSHSRAISSYHADNADRFDIVYHADPSADETFRTVTNAQGKEAVYRFIKLHGAWKLYEIEGKPTANCLADVQKIYWFTDTGWLGRAVDRAGNETRYQYWNDFERWGLLKYRWDAYNGDDVEKRRFFFEYRTDAPYIRLPEQVSLGYPETAKRAYYVYDDTRRVRRLHVYDESLPVRTPGRSRQWSIEYTYHDPVLKLQVATLTVDGPRTDTDSADKTVYEFSAAGYLTKVINAAGHVTQYLDHNGMGQPGTIIDANQVQTALTYTALGWVATVTEDVGGVNALTILQHDNVGQLERIMLADNSAYEFTYDDARRLVAIENSLGERITIQPDVWGNPDRVTIADARQAISRSMDLEFDDLGRFLQRLGSYGQKIEVSYADARNNNTDDIRSIDDGVNPPTMFGYDKRNRLVSMEDAVGRATQIDYDMLNRVERVDAPGSFSAAYSVDLHGNLRSAYDGDSGNTDYQYDNAGNRTSMTDARGVRTNYSYDVLNRLTQVTYESDSSRNVTLSYDGADSCAYCKGRLNKIADSSGTTLFEYDALGRVTRRSNTVKIPGQAPLNLDTGFTYNAAGRLTAVQYPNGQGIEYVLDSAGKIASVARLGSARSPGKLIATDISFQPFGPLSGVGYGNGLVLERDFDLDGRLAVEHIKGVQELTYHYTPVNTIGRIDNLLDPERNQYFGYDGLYRLTSATGKYGTIAYEYDEAGNRLRRQIMRNGTLTREDYTYYPRNHRLNFVYTYKNEELVQRRRYDYDASGNLERVRRSPGLTSLKNYLTLDHDVTGRMQSVSPD